MIPLRQGFGGQVPLHCAGSEDLSSVAPKARRGMIVTGIPLSALHFAWPELGRLLEPAIRSSPDKPDVLAELLGRRADLWGVYEDGKAVAAVVTAKQADGRCLAWLVGGSRMRDWAQPFLAALAAAARANGCWAIWGTGRRGWARVMPKLGFQRIADHDGRPAWERRIA
jgi:hypothetical protein